MNCAHTNLASDSSHGQSSNAVKPQGRPSIEVPETSYDFGKIGNQSIISHDFKIRNNGTAPLEIKRVQSL